MCLLISMAEFQIPDGFLIYFHHTEPLFDGFWPWSWSMIMDHHHGSWWWIMIMDDDYGSLSCIMIMDGYGSLSCIMIMDDDHGSLSCIIIIDHYHGPSSCIVIMDHHHLYKYIIGRGIITTTTIIITEFLVAEACVKIDFLTILCLCSQGRRKGDPNI